mgnify:CR=1 FL=1
MPNLLPPGRDVGTDFDPLSTLGDYLSPGAGGNWNGAANLKGPLVGPADMEQRDVVQPLGGVGRFGSQGNDFHEPITKLENWPSPF